MTQTYLNKIKSSYVMPLSFYCACITLLSFVKCKILHHLIFILPMKTFSQLLIIQQTSNRILYIVFLTVDVYPPYVSELTHDFIK